MVKDGLQARVSPQPGTSILMKSAPRSPSIIVQKGPARTRVRSMTLTPLRSVFSVDIRDFSGKLRFWALSGVHGPRQAPHGARADQAWGL